MGTFIRHAARAALTVSALFSGVAAQASSYTESFTDVTFYYSGFSSFNGVPSDGAAHSFFAGDTSFAEGVADEGAMLRMTGVLNYELVLDAETAGRCDSAQLWFGMVVGPVALEPHGPPMPVFCQSTPQVISKSMSIDSGFVTLSAGAASAYFVDLTQLGFDPTPIPEPETYALTAIGLGLIPLAARRRRKA